MDLNRRIQREKVMSYILELFVRQRPNEEDREQTDVNLNTENFLGMKISL